MAWQKALSNWERLVDAALRREQLRGTSGLASEGSGIGATSDAVPPSLLRETNIETILQAADEIQADNPSVSRILCEYAYTLAQNLDPKSEGRGVLQFKTGLKSVIKQKLSRREGERIDRSQDISLLWEYYKYYRQKHNVDELKEQGRQWRAAGDIDAQPGELKIQTERSKRVFETLRVLKEVLEALTQASPEAAANISEEMKRMMESDAAKVEEFKPYNILPLEAPGVADAIILLPEVRGAISAVEYTSDLPQLPQNYSKPKHRPIDIFDLLHFIFGFQTDNVINQREHLLLLLANSQSKLEVLHDKDTQLDEEAVTRVFDRTLANYNRWCSFVRARPVTARCATHNRQRKVLLVSLYFLIWGEAANLRFLPECLCYIFHMMTEELYTILDGQLAQRSKMLTNDSEYGFLHSVVSPIYELLSAEAANTNDGKASHAASRNYDDFNEYFWSHKCFELHWPWKRNGSFFLRPKPKKRNTNPDLQYRKGRYGGKVLFVEHRTFIHMYHSFHRLWIFLVLMLQALTIFAFHENLHLVTIKRLLSLGPTYVVMKFAQCVFDVILLYGAYSSTSRSVLLRILFRFLFFGASAALLTILYVQVLNETSQGVSDSSYFKIYLLIIGVYAAFHFFISVIMRLPFCYRAVSGLGEGGFVHFIKWVHQERYYVGRGLYESAADFLRYFVFWIVVLGAKFSFAYFLLIRPLVRPSRAIVDVRTITYDWHDFVSKGNHNALTLVSLWAPVILIYFLDTQIWYTVLSALVGGLSGAKDRLGEIRSITMLRRRFESFPRAFVETLDLGNKVNAAKFAPFWNEFILSLREEDYISDRHKDLLLMPGNNSILPLVQWPLFLLASKVYIAIGMAEDHKGNQDELLERIRREEYLYFAIEEIYHSVQWLLKRLLHDEAKTWIRTIFQDIDSIINEGHFVAHFNLQRLHDILGKVTTLTAVLIRDQSPENLKSAVKALQDLYETVMREFLSVELREKYEGWGALVQALREDRLFGRISWPRQGEERDQVKRLHSLLSLKESAVNIPRNLEARRRLQFFTNSLFMNMPAPLPVQKMLSFSVFTPYYSEDVMYSKDQLRKDNEDGISILFYLQKIFPDEWRNFLERIKITEAELERQLNNKSLDLIELRLWASYRGQTLARTVRGMMYYRRALILQSFLEQSDIGDVEDGLSRNHQDYLLSRGARAQSDLKFTYVVTCQIYGEQKHKRDQRATDINYLMQKNEALRIAYIDVVETLREGKIDKEYYSKLIKTDASGKDQDIYTIKLPGNPKLGEGKPENQNHAIIFTRGDAIQTIDMNQDNYFEEALKMRNLLQEFDSNHGLRPPSILGVREHVFTGSVSSLAWFMSSQETSFVTLGQRVLAKPLKVRMHYGHPDVFDRIFHITRGGISKASRVINISEDIFAGFNSTLRRGNITHHEYIQVGKGRDVGLNQIALFEAKVSSGNGEQMLSRDVYRLGQLFDFFRMLSFFYTTVGYYICTMFTVWTVYAFLYGKIYLSLSGVEASLRNTADVLDNTALESALNAQFLFQIGFLTAVPMIMGLVLEQGVLKAIISFITMQLQLCSVFFTFSLGTKSHYFGRTILHGGAKYRATGRGFVVRHIPFAENYRLYSRSHFVKGLEVVMLLIVYMAYGVSSGTSYFLLSFSSWFLAISWMYAPYLFNPSGFEWQKTVDDFDDWTNWLLYKGGVGVKGEESWEAWWDEEQEHIRTFRSRILETILSLRFFIFQYGVVYKLHVTGTSTSLTAYGVSWVVFAAFILLFKIFSLSQKTATNIQLFLRLMQGVIFILLLGGLIAAIVASTLTVGDIFASALALLPTGWGILSIAIAWRPVIKFLGLWKSMRSLARLYDAGMGTVIFVPVAILSWFPFVSTFQSRLLFNQAFSRGLEISLILAGNRPNTST
ncbi:glucan synthase like 7 [Selaginella moellendorffii]|uniref:1,3-beta-glucan synthase n=1 Tax=Selaginella moellendorffii TaxID=88036 RepID=D8T771_SELML|nr:glucan synthase like 7 [Selaginella moellendorffii]